MMPYEATAPWSVGAISGVFRFLKRVWDLSANVEDGEMSVKDEFYLNKSVKKVGEDLELIHFNTAVSTLMEWINYLTSKDKVTVVEYQTLLKLIAPFAPHMSEEIWHQMNSSATSLHLESWPEFDESKIVEEEVNIAVQINGKVRGLISIPSEMLKDQPQIEEKAKADPNISKYFEGANIKKIIYIPGKILSFVV